jgi:hypothetical protein
MSFQKTSDRGTHGEGKVAAEKIASRAVARQLAALMQRPSEPAGTTEVRRAVIAKTFGGGYVVKLDVPTTTDTIIRLNSFGSHHEWAYRPGVRASLATQAWPRTAPVKTLFVEYPEVSAPRATTATESTARRFRVLADHWRQDTGMMASPKRRFMHNAYQQIIGMGRDAVPLILAELRDRPDDWFWALAAITGEDPAKGEVEFEKARAQWLDWAKSRRYL